MIHNGTRPGDGHSSVLVPWSLLRVLLLPPPTWIRVSSVSDSLPLPLWVSLSPSLYLYLSLCLCVPLCVFILPRLPLSFPLPSSQFEPPDSSPDGPSLLPSFFTHVAPRTFVYSSSHQTLPDSHSGTTSHYLPGPTSWHYRHAPPSRSPLYLRGRLRGSVPTHGSRNRGYRSSRHTTHLGVTAHRGSSLDGGHWVWAERVVHRGRRVFGTRCLVRSGVWRLDYQSPHESDV